MCENNISSKLTLIAILTACSVFTIAPNSISKHYLNFTLKVNRSVPLFSDKGCYFYPFYVRLFKNHVVACLWLPLKCHCICVSLLCHVFGVLDGVSCLLPIFCTFLYWGGCVIGIYRVISSLCSCWSCVFSVLCIVLLHSFICSLAICKIEFIIIPLLLLRCHLDKSWHLMILSLMTSEAKQKRVRQIENGGSLPLNNESFERELSKIIVRKYQRSYYQ